MVKNINAVTLFSNIGVGEWYLPDCGVNVVAACELLPDRGKIYSHFHKSTEMVNGDILDPKIFNRLIELYKEHDCSLVIATPPCQGMSISNAYRLKDDIRNKLIIPTIDFIKETLPENIIIENVEGVLKTYILVNDKPILIKDYITKELAPLGYIINPVVVNAKDYGTPQSRKRAVFLISRKGFWDLPPKQPIITVRDAIGDLPSLESGESSDIKYHNSKKISDEHINWIKHTPTGQSAHKNPAPYFPCNNDGTRNKTFQSMYARLPWDSPSYTITGGNNSISNVFYHPGHKQPNGTYSDARLITLLEVIRLTGLPDDWPVPEWCPENQIRLVLGEQFPPRLVEALISTIPPQKLGQKTLF